MLHRLISQCFVWLFLFTCSVSADDTRLYSGEIQVPTMGALQMTLGVSETNEGAFLFLTVPTQGAKDIPLEATYTQDGALSAELAQAGLSFVVTENDDFTKLTGEMHQGLVFEIDFDRVVEIAELVRPQNPTEPYPYDSREVTSLHPDGHLLQGTLTIPEGRGPFPCAVLISGSGPQDRDESIMGHKPFLVISDYLTRNGIAVLRYDDRG
ncbi:MAG: alpha/beta hydrolase, partial [Phycisphaerae bacterium]|nr:alpha/beta hydrolase [Phycisphaerae bacterium]